MADIRCPMCGTSNPAGAEVCSNCQARLTPMQANGSAPDNFPAFDSSLFGGEEDNENTDWLSSLRGESANIEDAPQTEEEQAPIDTPEEEPEWLKQVRKRHLESQSAAPTGNLVAPTDTPPDWLMQIKEESSAGSENVEPAVNFPAEMPQTAEAETAASQPASPEGSDDDWFRSLSDWQTPVAEDSFTQAPAEENSPIDFSSAAFSESGSDIFETQESQVDLPSGDLPGWLDTPITPAFTGDTDAVSANTEDALPDWLNNISGSTEPAADNAFSAPESPFTMPEEEPANEAASQPFAFTENLEGTGSDMPEWLQTFSAPVPQEENPSTTDAESNAFLSEEASETPVGALFGNNEDYSWLDQIQENDESTVVETSSSGVFFTDDDGSSQTPFEGFDITTAAPLSQSVQPFESSSLPDWLSDFGAEDQGESEEAALPAEETPLMPFKEDSLEWLSSASPLAVEEEMEDGAATPAIAPAQLPGWLEAMRPVESFAMGSAALASALEDDKHIEKSGPLAGLKATLTSEGKGFEYRKPPIYSNKLHVTEKQRVHANLLESLMADSGRLQASAKKSKDRPWILRLIIGLVLLLVTAVFLYTGGTSSSSRDLPSIEAIQFANAIETLPPDSSVILAVDYQPAFDGELHIGVASVLQHLMEKKANIILVSTSSSGPAIGEGLLIESWSNLNSANEQAAAEYSLKDKTVNLGYLPGGITSLQDFALNPRLAAPAGYREVLNYVSSQPQVVSVWQSPVVNNLITPANANAILVATDSIEMGRAWIEQVQPYNSSTPMLLITSAQAAPLLRPYVAAKQAQGMLSGMSEGLAYKDFLQQPNRHTGYSSALYAAVAFSILLVLAGAVVQMINGLLKQTRRKKEVS